MGWGGVYQRTLSDCGCAALGTMVGLNYDRMAKEWQLALGKQPSGSHYADLLKVLRHLEIPAEKVISSNWGIRRARCRKGDRHSHWIMTYSDGGIWCPTLGFFESIKEYGMPHLGHGIITL